MVVDAQVLSQRSAVPASVFTDDCRQSISLMLLAKAEEEAQQSKSQEKSQRTVQADDVVPFAQLMSRADLGGLEDVFESSLSQALSGSGQRSGGPDLSVSKLNKVRRIDLIGLWGESVPIMPHQTGSKSRFGPAKAILFDHNSGIKSKENNTSV